MNPNHTHWSPQRQALFWNFGLTTLFCFAIAYLLWVIGLADPFSLLLGISLCIGWSISTVHLVAGAQLENRLGFGLSNTVATALGLAIAFGIISLYFRWSGIRLEGLNWRTAVIALFFGVIGTTIFTALARVHQMREDLSKSELERLTTERALAEAKLKTLQAQIEPHFLFNTLTTAIGLIHTQPKAAEQTLQQLTKLLRNSLSRTRTEHSTVAEEMSLIEAYLQIAKIRMGDRLQFSVQTDPSLKEFNLPPMLVQPLVENALTHGLEPSEDGGEISVEFATTQSGISITVTDTGLGLEGNTQSSGTNTGLRNVRDRLQQLYSGQSSLKLAENSPSGVIATLTIPAQPNSTAALEDALT